MSPIDPFTERSAHSRALLREDDRERDTHYGTGPLSPPMRTPPSIVIQSFIHETESYLKWLDSPHCAPYIQPFEFELRTAITRARSDMRGGGNRS